MKRITSRTEPYYCNPLGGCVVKDCPGRPDGDPESHGMHTDEWFFTVVHDGYALTLVAFGTDLHKDLPEDHPARMAPGGLLRDGWPRKARGAHVAGCRALTEESDNEDCPYLGVPCESKDVSYLLANNFWQNCGDSDARLEQPESFWEGLELLARTWCGHGCELTEEEDAKLTGLVKTTERPMGPKESKEVGAMARDLFVGAVLAGLGHGGEDPLRLHLFDDGTDLHDGEGEGPLGPAHYGTVTVDYAYQAEMHVQTMHKERPKVVRWELRSSPDVLDATWERKDGKIVMTMMSEWYKGEWQLGVEFP